MGDGDTVRDQDHCREVRKRHSLGENILRGKSKFESAACEEQSQRGCQPALLWWQRTAPCLKQRGEILDFCK